MFFPILNMLSNGGRTLQAVLVIGPLSFPLLGLDPRCRMLVKPPDGFNHGNPGWVLLKASVHRPIISVKKLGSIIMDFELLI